MENRLFCEKCEDFYLLMRPDRNSSCLLSSLFAFRFGERTDERAESLREFALEVLAPRGLPLVLLHRGPCSPANSVTIFVQSAGAISWHQFRNRGQFINIGNFDISRLEIERCSPFSHLLLFRSQLQHVDLLERRHVGESAGDIRRRSGRFTCILFHNSVKVPSFFPALVLASFHEVNDARTLAHRNDFAEESRVLRSDHRILLQVEMRALLRSFAVVRSEC